MDESHPVLPTLPTHAAAFGARAVRQSHLSMAAVVRQECAPCRIGAGPTRDDHS